MAKDPSNVQTVIGYNIERINNAKSTLKTYLTDNDVAVADGTKIDAMAEQLSEVKVGASTAAEVSYTNESLPDVSNVNGALDSLVSKSHTHSNKSTLDKLADSNGSLTYNGKAAGGAWYVDVTPSDNADMANKTATEVYAAYEAGYSVYARISIKGIPYAIPLKAAVKNDNTILLGFSTSGADTTQNVTYPIVTWNGSVWNIRVFDLLSLLKAEDVKLHSGASVEYAISQLKSASHEHDNKAVLDLLSAADGKLQYDGNDVASVTKDNVVAALGFTPKAVSAQVATGTEITLADNTEYRLTDVTTLTLTYPTGNFECWLKLTFAASGSITVTLPTGTEYLGIIPDFKNGEVWELSIKDGVVVGEKVGGDSGSSAPVKGVDYWTETDKQEIINDVIAALPDGTEVSY